MIPPLIPSSINFGYKSELKDEFRSNPEMREHVKRGIYGGRLTTENLTVEHIRPHSKGGSSGISNLALATKTNNEARSSAPLVKHLTKPMVDAYTKQFEGWEAKSFNNQQYIQNISKSIQKEGVDLGIPGVAVGRTLKKAKHALKQVNPSAVKDTVKQVASEAVEEVGKQLKILV